MNFSKYVRLSVFLLLMFGLVPIMNLTEDSFSISMSQINKAHAFQGTQGMRVDYTISTNYWVDLDYGDELCSYENTETIHGQRCEDSWMTCTADGHTFTSISYTGNSICISLDEIY